jgi:hypothetical protein
MPFLGYHFIKGSQCKEDKRSSRRSKDKKDTEVVTDQSMSVSVGSLRDMEDTLSTGDGKGSSPSLILDNDGFPDHTVVYEAPPGAIHLSEGSLTSEESFSGSPTDTKQGHLLMNEMSDASRGFLATLMGQGGENATPEPVQTEPSSLLMDQVSDASKGLLDTLMGLDDDFAALQSARYIAPEGARVVNPPKTAPSPTLLMDQISGSSRDLLASLMVSTDDVAALQGARFVAPPGGNIVCQDSFSSYDVSSSSCPSDEFDDVGPLLLDKISDASKELLAALVVLKSDMGVLQKAKVFAPAQVQPPLLMHEMSDASRGLLATLMGQGDDVRAIESARYIAPQGGKIVKPPNPMLLTTLLIDRMSEASKGLLSSLMGQDDDIAALQSARYVAPRGAKNAVLPATEVQEQLTSRKTDERPETSTSLYPYLMDKFKQEQSRVEKRKARLRESRVCISLFQDDTSRSVMDQASVASQGLIDARMTQDDDRYALSPPDAKIVQPPKESTLLADQVSEASRYLSATLMDQDDSMTALQSAHNVPPPGAKIVEPPLAESTLLTDQMSEASRGLLANLMGQDDDMASLHSAKYFAPPGAKIVKPPKELILLTDQMSQASRGLLTTLMVPDDDMAALQSARFVPLPGAKLVTNVSLASREGDADADEPAPFLMDQMSDASKGLLASLMGQNDDVVAFQSARYVAPPRAKIGSIASVVSTDEDEDESDQYEPNAPLPPQTSRTAEASVALVADEDLQLLLQQMSAVSKEMLLSTTMMSAASKDLLATVIGQLSSMLLAHQHEAAAESELHDETDDEPPSEAILSTLSQNKEDVLARQHARYAMYVAASPELLEGDGDSHSPPAALQTTAAELPVVLAGEDYEGETEQEGEYETDQEGEYESDQEDDYETVKEDEYETEEGETGDESPSQAIRMALSQTKEDVMAQQHARFVQYLADASEQPESDDDSSQPPAAFQSAAPEPVVILPADDEEDKGDSHIHEIVFTAGVEMGKTTRREKLCLDDIFGQMMFSHDGDAAPVLEQKDALLKSGEGESDQDEDEDEDKSDEDEDESVCEFPPNGIHGALEDVMAQQQARYTQYLAAASEYPEGLDESSHHPPPKVQRTATEVTDGLPKQDKPRPIQSLAEKMAQFLETVPVE